MLANVVLAVPVLILVVCAIHDVRSFRIPNAYVSSLLICWPIAIIVQQVPLQHASLALLIGAVFLIAGFTLFAMRLLGAGDAKLLAAIAPWIGMEAVIPFIMYTTLSGAALAILLLYVRKSPIPVAAMRFAWVVQMYDRERDMPYGVAIAIGGIVSLPQSVLFVG